MRTKVKFKADGTAMNVEGSMMRILKAFTALSVIMTAVRNVTSRISTVIRCK